MYILYISGSQPVVRGPLVVHGHRPGGPRAKPDIFSLFTLNLAIEIKIGGIYFYLHIFALYDKHIIFQFYFYFIWQKQQDTNESEI